MVGENLAWGWFMDILTNIVVPALIWALILAGLVWVVKDKLEEGRREDLELSKPVWDVPARRICSKSNGERR